MDLFNDIDFNDDNDILTSSILSNDVKEIAYRFAKEIDWMKVSYEIYDHYLIILDKDSYEDYNKGEQLTFDNVKLPFNPDCICLTFKFNNNYTRIEYIQVYPYMYSTNKTRISDDDFYAIKFANILYDEYNIITDKIIYGYDDITYNNVRDSFCVIYNRRRVKSNNDYTISDGFASNFPKLLNIKSECIANIAYVRQLSIQDETTCISLLNSLLKQFNKVMVNTCTTCIDNIPIYQFDKRNPKFFDILADNSEIRYDGDDYAIIDKNTINIKIFKDLPKEANLVANDLIIMDINLAKKILNIDEENSTDIVLNVPNDLEKQNIKEQLILKHSNIRILQKENLKKEYENMFNYKGGIFLVLFIVVIFTFILILYQRYSMISSSDKKEIGILKAVGWSIKDIIKLKIIENFIVGFMAFIIGVVFAYIFVFIFNAPILRNIFIGFSNVQNDFILNANIEFSTLITLFLFFIIPFLSAVLIPVWKIAVIDANESMK